MNIAVLVKQVQGDAGPAMDTLSRQAVAQGAELAAAVGDGVCTAITIGGPDAGDALREAIAWGRLCSVTSFGVLLADDAPADRETLATARALATALTRDDDPFELVLLGAESDEAGTGQLGPQLAELLDLPFVAAARYLSMQGRRLHVRGAQDGGWLQATVAIPAVVSCAAGLIDPCEATPEARSLVPADLIRTVGLAELTSRPGGAAPAWPREASAPVAVLAAPGRPRLTGQMIRHAATLAAPTGSSIVVVDTEELEASALSAWGADEVVTLLGAGVEEDVARAVATWIEDTRPRVLLAGATSWGHEVAGRVAARLGVGVASDVAAVSPELPIAIVRPGTIDAPAPRPSTPITVTTRATSARGRVRVASRTRPHE